MAAHDVPPALAFLGGEIARARQRAGLTQQRLAAELLYSRSFIGNIESGLRLPKREVVSRLDEVFGTDGLLLRAWAVASEETVSARLRVLANDEQAASLIHTYEQQVAPDLLQTRDYARAVLAARRMADDEYVGRQAEALMRRQEILSRREPPVIRAIVDEIVLCRPLGGSDILAGQLQQLIDLGSLRHITVQVMLVSAGAHVGLDGPMTIVEHLDGYRVLYATGQAGAHMVTDPAAVGGVADRMHVLRAQALSPEDSAALIRRALDEL